MAEAAVEAAPPGQQPQPAAANGSVMGMMLRMGVMYLIMSYLRGGGKAKDATNSFKCKFEKGEAVDMQVYVSTDPSDMGSLVWEEKGLPLASWTPGLAKSIEFSEKELHPIIHENATAWLTTTFSRSAVEELPDAAEGQPAAALPASFYVQTKLVSYKPPPKAKKGKFLLGDKGAPAAEPEADTAAAPALEDDEPTEAAAKPWIPYWKPNITIALVDDFSVHASDKLPPYFSKLVKLDTATRTYYPAVTLSDFWLLQDYLVPLNETVTNVTLHLDLTTMSSWYLQLQMAMEQSFDMQKSGGMIQDGESDELKRVFLEGNPYLLAITTVVSLLHSVFDMLAFKNDIGFWKNNKSMEGLSARTIIINAVCQLVIFLYLMDNQTSYVVLFSSGVGTLIEFWKVTKAMNVTVEWTSSGMLRIQVQDRGSYVTSKTKQYDDEAMRYLSWLLFPLIIGYSIYSLMYSEHKSWYSWVLGSLVGCVYTFGFVLMCPQLYLNYKLKSVAHLPWRQMTYKFLNTIIDDLFAFVIKMPTLHRLSVFRDDIVFLVLIYQRWIYPVDKARVNEFGFSDEAPVEPAELADAPDGDTAGDAAAGTKAKPESAEAAAGVHGKRKAAKHKTVAEADALPTQPPSSSKAKAT